MRNLSFNLIHLLGNVLLILQVSEVSEKAVSQSDCRKLLLVRAIIFEITDFTDRLITQFPNRLFH
jgi:hypothetical protein